VKALLYGSRPDGHAKVVVDVAAERPELELVGLVDDYPENAARTIRGLRVLGTRADLARVREESGASALLLGFGQSSERAEIAAAAVAAGFELPALVHSSARVSGSAQLGPGTQVLTLSFVGPDARLGTGVLVNSAAVVEHDCVLEDGVVVGPGAILCGRVRVGREATVGAGATVLPDVSIGAGGVVGAGALVRADVAGGTTVAGVPARPL
jgi:sugar O-acyltransferase (sialic acid O-acetyltransferase NeuD family)